MNVGGGEIITVVLCQGRGDELAEHDGTNYFEKICLRGAAVDNCRDKTWAFERVPNRKLEGFDDKIIEQVPNRRDCEELCLAEKRYHQKLFYLQVLLENI